MKTMIGIPTMGTVPVRFMASLLAMKRAGDVEFEMTDHSLIYDARNRIAKTAIDEGFDRVLWLDSDMVFSPDLMERLSERLDQGREFVSALYFKRKQPPEPVIYRDCCLREDENGKPVPSAVAYRDFPENALFEIAGSGFGAVMTTVQLLKDVYEAYGLPFSPAAGLGEDLSFCARVAELGRKMWCDSSILLGHVGQKIYTREDWDGWMSMK